MAGETQARTWWLICRRDGHIVARIKLPIALTREQTDLDPLVGPLQYTKDFDLIDHEAIHATEDQPYFVNYEVIGTTNNFEIADYE